MADNRNEPATTTQHDEADPYEGMGVAMWIVLAFVVVGLFILTVFLATRPLGQMFP